MEAKSLRGSIPLGVSADDDCFLQISANTHFSIIEDELLVVPFRGYGVDVLN
jgi:hypothetical protein